MPSADYDADTLAGIIEDALTENMSLGASGRWIADYGVTPADLAESIATRVIPPREPHAQVETARAEIHQPEGDADE